MDSSKKRYLFGKSAEQWKLPAEYLGFATALCVREKAFKEADKFYHLEDKVVWDMFAGIGSDAVTLGQYCKTVHCTEIKKEIVEQYLIPNTDQFGNGNIQTHHSDCSSSEQKLDPSPDLVYFDPPWGSTYKPGKEFSFEGVTLDNGQNVLELLDRIREQYPKLIIKAPFNCQTFEKRYNDYIARVITFPRPKLKFIFLI